MIIDTNNNTIAISFFATNTQYFHPIVISEYIKNLIKLAFALFVCVNTILKPSLKKCGQLYLDMDWQLKAVLFAFI